MTDKVVFLFTGIKKTALICNMLINAAFQLAVAKNRLLFCTHKHVTITSFFYLTSFDSFLNSSVPATFRS